jgi:two-component system, response regulator PdtaR
LWLLRPATRTKPLPYISPDIALLFTDIDMPGSVDGLKLAHAVRGRWPPVKILVVSGHVRPRQADLPSNSCFIGKPYGAAAMVEELRSLIGSPILAPF